jgi:hypothetical protein
MTVKFRDISAQGTLGMLNSGGERSVSTMMFLASLQPHTKTPVRLVDEINQGMDMNNERKVFELLSLLVERTLPQFFLITPKLLPDLPFRRGTTVLVIFNGAHSISHKSKFVKKKKDQYKTKHLLFTELKIAERLEEMEESQQ